MLYCDTFALSVACGAVDDPSKFGCWITGGGDEKCILFARDLSNTCILHFCALARRQRAAGVFDGDQLLCARDLLFFPLFLASLLLKSYEWECKIHSQCA